MSHDVINTSSLYAQLKTKFDIEIIMVEKKFEYLTLYFNSNVDFIIIKKFIIDNISNVRTVRVGNKFSTNCITIEFLYNKKYN